MPAPDQEALRLTEDFIAAINERDVRRLAKLMSDDHRFVDAAGAVHVGREKMKAGWADYFAAFPEYRIEVETKIASDGVVAVFGWASGRSRHEPASGGPRSWRIPAAWKAVVRDDAMAEWQVCCDVEPMLRSMGVNRW